MPVNYTAYARQQQNMLSPTDIWLVLLEITHTSAPLQPVRFVVDTQELTSNGNQYMPIAARIEFPPDIEGNRPNARITIDNVGRSLMRIVEDTHGMRGATVRIMQVYRSRPDIIEQEITLDLTDITATQMNFSAGLTFDTMMDAPSTPLTYRPATKPGLF